MLDDGSDRSVRPFRFVGANLSIMHGPDNRAAAEEVATTLVPRVFTIAARAGTEGRLFGSVTTADIAAAVESQANVRIDRRKLVLGEPIKTLGTHTVPVKLHADVEFPVTVDVVAE